MPGDSHHTPSEYLLRLERVSKSYGGLRALHDVSVGIGYGEIHCLVGENGSGKSTLIKIVSGVERADSGEILFENKSFARFTCRRLDSPRYPGDLSGSISFPELNGRRKYRDLRNSGEAHSRHQLEKG